MNDNEQLIDNDGDLEVIPEQGFPDFN